MKHSFLIQRLETPFILKDGQIDASCLAFGGGLRNGGIAEDAMKMLKQIWSFDYMGSAEFEFGAVNEALEKLTREQIELVAGFFSVPYKYEQYNWGDTPEQKYSGTEKVFYLCRKEDESEVKDRIKTFAIAGTSEVRVHTKEVIGLDRAMSPAGITDRRPIVGWLELDNGYMFFTDVTMWRRTCDLFGVKTPSKKKMSKE